jgi:hypothetical protein
MSLTEKDKVKTTITLYSQILLFVKKAVKMALFDKI